jgi:hypothetical protein
MNFKSLVGCALLATAVMIAITAIIINCKTRRERASGLKWWRYIFAIVIAFAPLICVWQGVTTASRLINIVAIFAAIIAYCYFALASFGLAPKVLGILAGSLLTAPIIIGLLALPFSGLGLFLVLGDVTAPYTESRMPNGFVCRTKQNGYSFSGEELDVELLRPLYGVAFLRVSHNNFSYSQAALQHDEACANVYIRLTNSPK